MYDILIAATASVSKAVLKLGRLAEATVAKDELLALVPNFDRSGRSLIHRVVFLDENVAMLLDGLCKAGLELEKKVS